MIQILQVFFIKEWVNDIAGNIIITSSKNLEEDLD